MDCNIFRKKLEDLIEDNLAYDLREAMFEHINECQECSDLYKEELEIDEMFKTALSVDTQNFRSLRSDIMKNIDKNRYSGNPVKKIFSRFRNHRATYSSLAAIIVVFAILVPYVRSHKLFSSEKTTDMVAPKSATANGIQNQAMSTKSIATNDNTLGIDSSKSAGQDDMRTPQYNNLAKNNVDNSYIPIFEKKVLDKGTNVKFNTPWKDSLNKKYSATVEGKGTEALEEGVGSVVIKDMKNGQQWVFNLLDNQRQFSPKIVQWVDDENILVIVGLGYGTVHQGGEIYLLNINTALAVKADPQNTAKLDDRSEITKIQTVKMIDTNMLSINVEVLVYEDNLLNKNHREIRTLTSPFSEIVKDIQP